MIAFDRRVVAVAVSVFAVLLAALSLGAVRAQAQGPEPVHLVSFLNNYRAKVNLPGQVEHDAKWSEACRLHNVYSRLNSSIGHSETPGLPGYTTEGAWAAKVSVLYWGSKWTVDSNPFETAPFHLHQLLNPRLDRVGASENDDFGCMTSLASRNRPAPSRTTTYTYPAENQTHRPSEVAAEGPYTPGSKVGIPEGTRTGPYLYVMFDGPWNAGWSYAQVSSATLTGPNGTVETKVVDQKTPGAGQYLPIGAQVIPVQPLQPNSRYTATVTGKVTDPYAGHADGKWVPKVYDVSHTWAFNTSGARAAATPAPVLRQDPSSPLTETDHPAPQHRRAYRPPIPEVLDADVRGANVHVKVDVGDVGQVRAILSNRRHRSRGNWKTIDVRKDSIGTVKLVGRVPVGVSWIRVDSKNLEDFQPEVEHGPKDHPEGHSDILGPEGTPENGGAEDEPRGFVVVRD
jgi:hypothetical protein